MLEKTIFDRYALDEQAGESDLLLEYHGRDTQTDQRVKVTAIKPKIVSAADFLSRFEPLVSTIARLKSPHAVPVIMSGEAEGQAVVVREHIEGQSLADLIAGGNGLAIDLAVNIARQLGEYLDALHRQGILQMVFNPEEIFLSAESVLRVMDLGLAQGLNIGVLLSKGKVKAGPYHAPELLRGEPADNRTDFFSVGVLLFTALTGKEPDAKALAGKTPTLADFYPSRLCPGSPPELDELVAKCLHPNPSKRIQSVAEFRNKLKEVQRGMEAGGRDTLLGMEDSLVGQTLGTYQLVERLGQGGMATVYKAYEPGLDRYVAVKVLPQFFANDPSFSHRFRREAKAVAQLSHPNIVPIYNFGEEGGITYIVMQLMEGGALKRERGQVYDWKDALRLLLPIARALEYAHQRGVVHRDIKPSNVLLTGDKWPVLADFGLVQMAEASAKLTGTGVGLGTPAYMSPEQGQGATVDARTDIYSLGIMFYEMVTGDVPFKADTPMAIVIKHLTAPMPLPRQVNPAIPKEIEEIILKATAKDPDGRYQTAEEMATAMDRALNRVAMPKEKPAPKEKAPAKEKIRVEKPAKKEKIRVAKPAFRLKLVYILAPLAVVLLILGGVFGPRWIASLGAKGAVTPTFTLAAPTATNPPTSVPTAIPLAWSRLSSGQFLLRDQLTAIALDPSDPEVLYVGTQNAGVYKSIDGGLSWQPVHNGLGRAPINALLIDPQNPQTLYAGASSGKLYKTTDGGISWQTLEPGVEQTADQSSALAMDSQDPLHLLFSDGWSLFVESKNGGESWNLINDSPDCYFNSLVISPLDAQRVFALGSCNSERGMYTSVDGGKTWNLTALKGDEVQPPFLVEITLQRKEFIYVNAGEGLTYVSADEGASWKPISQRSCNTLATDPHGGVVAYCSGKLVKTTDGGETWEVLSEDSTADGTVLAVSPQSSQVIYGGKHQLFVSSDGGLSWSERASGLGAFRAELSLAPSGAILLDEVSGYLHRSLDGGHNWEKIYDGGDGLAVGADGMLYRTEADYLKASPDGGKTWNQITLPLSTAGNRGYRVSAHPTMSGVIYLAYENPGHIFASADGGLHWEEYPWAWPAPRVDLGSDLGQADFFFGQGRVVYMIPWYQSFYSSEEGKASWRLCAESYWSSPGKYRFAIDPHDSNQVYLAVIGRGVFKSQDHCQSWTSAKNGLGSLFVNALAIDPNNPDTIYAGTDGGAYISFDGGQAWGEINDGLLGATVVYSIVVDPQSKVYAATPYGVFQLESEISNAPLPGSTPVPTWTALPVPFASPGAGGIPADPCYSLGFKADMSIPDGTIMKPGQTFDKTWLVENNGTCTWEAGFKFVFIGGEAMGGTTLTLSEAVLPGSQTMLSVPMVAPFKTGTFIGIWNMYTSRGEYFLKQNIFVNIKVEEQ